MWGHPQIVYWLAQEVMEKKGIPLDTALVLLTDKLGHKHSWRVRRFAQKADTSAFLVPVSLTIGAVKRILVDLLGDWNAQRTVLERKPKTFTPQELNNFMRKHSSPRAEHPQRTVQELYALALRRGYAVSRRTMRDAYSALRKRECAPAERPR